MPTLVLLLLTPFFSWGADDYDNLTKMLQANSCSTSATDATPVCKAAAFDYCGRASDSSCATYLGTAPPSGLSFDPSLLSGTDAKTLTQSAKTMFSNQIARAQRLAGICCDGGAHDDTKCKNQFLAGSPARLGLDAVDAATQTVASGSGAQGINGGQATLATGLANNRDAAAGLAGACMSNKQICKERAQALSKAILAKADAAGADKDAVKKLGEQYQAQADACDKLSAAGAVANTNANEDAQKQTQKQELQTASTGSSAAGHAKASGDGMGGFNPAQLMQALQGMQPKDDNQNNNDSSSPSPLQTAAADCSNVATAGCYRAAAKSWAATPAEAQGIASAGAGASGAANVGDTSGVTPQSFSPSTGAQAAPVSVAGVPSGGGGFGGMGGGSGGGAGGGSGGGRGGGSGVNTDIMHGEGGGGGLGAMNAGMSTAAGGSSGGYTYGKGAPAGEEPKPIDFRQFLPGGAKDPTRKLAGVAERSEISSATTNIWNRITERIRARCAQGLLRDCN